MNSLIVLALSCQMTHMMPDYYTADLVGPNAQGKYNLTLNYKFYGFDTEYKYVLKAEGKRLVGSDKRKDALAVDNIKQLGSNLFSLIISSNKEGRISMTCQNQ